MSTTTDSQGEYRATLNKYLENDLVASNKTDNPLLEIADSLENDIDREKRNKWERTASFIGLNNIFQNIGGIISSQNGVNAPIKDDGMFKFATSKADEYDKRINEKYNQLYKANLSNALNQIKRNQDIEDSYMKGLEKINEANIATNHLSMRLDDNEASRVSRENINTTQLDSRIKSYNLPTQSKKSEEPTMHVYSISGNRVGLNNEQVSRLYQIGKLSKLDYDYLNSKNENQRKREFDILIQQSYNLYEQNREKYDNETMIGPQEDSK